MISISLIVIAACTLVVATVIGLDFQFGIRRIDNLQQQPPQWGKELPMVSVIVPARNEERQIEQALRSLLRLDYPRLEITVVNDRSTDGTGAILARMKAFDPRLNIVSIEQLPQGWLGKNHAMQYGADRSRGEWLLFTDADVVFEPTVLRRAIPFALRNRLDHLTMAPDTCMPGWFLQSFVVCFAFYFYAYLRPWKVRDQRSSTHLGIGAFNLVRREHYRAAGGHAALAMRPDDDLKLAKVLKRCGGRAECLNGMGMISVEWYSSFRELVVGLEKNTFAVAEYQVAMVAATSLAVFMMHVWPFLAVGIYSGVAWWLNLGSIAILLSLVAQTANLQRMSPWRSLALPFAAATMIWIQWRSMLIALRSGGIRWRDTHYALRELRANRV